MGSVTIKPDGSIDVKGMQITVDASATHDAQVRGIVQVSGSQILLG